MRILIIRSGSGWGGIVSRYLIDTTEKIMINLYKCIELTKDTKYFSFNVLYLSLSDFPDQACSGYTFNIDLLESFLQSCELHKEPCTVMDQQVDNVYVLDENNDIRCVYDTDYDIWPDNPVLCAKLKKLIDICT